MALSIYSCSLIAHTWGVNFTIGRGKLKGNPHQSIAVNNEIINTYDPSASADITPWLAVGAYSQFLNSQTHQFVADLGIDYYFFKPFHGNGIDAPFSNAGSFDTLTYHYDLSSQALLVEPTFIYTALNWQPFFILGFGVAFNRLSNFNELPTDPNGAAAAPEVNFGNNHQQSLALEAGVGIQRVLLIHEGMEIAGLLDYRYISLGRGKFTPFPLQTGGEGFKMSSISLQTLNLGLRMQFDYPRQVKGIAHEK